jgi:two-component system KDP operon response regulator KdpE
MTRQWSLHQLIVKTQNRTPEPATRDERVSFAGLVEFGDFKIDFAEQTVTLCGQQLQLSPEEFDVLVFLSSHPQHVVTPRTVLATNSAENRRRHTEFLRALMSLRKKLEVAGPGKQYLRTEPWVLYRFNPTSSSAT